jgi:hypothetical protein
VRAFHITLNGTYVAGSDFAEALPARGDKADYERGDVLVLSTIPLGDVEKTSRPYDERVAGVYSTRPGMLGADKDGATRVDEDAYQWPSWVWCPPKSRLRTVRSKLATCSLLQARLGMPCAAMIV